MPIPVLSWGSHYWLLPAFRPARSGSHKRYTLPMDTSRRTFFKSIPALAALPASWTTFSSALQAASAPDPVNESYWSLVKRQFPLEENLIYLNAANVCPASRPVLDRHARCSDAGPEQRDKSDGDDADKTHHALQRATACSSAWKPVLSVDSSLCATFSVPPIAPGTLNTTSRAARAKMWWTGV